MPRSSSWCFTTHFGVISCIYAHLLYPRNCEFHIKNNLQKLVKKRAEVKWHLSINKLEIASNYSFYSFNLKTVKEYRFTCDIRLYTIQTDAQCLIAELLVQLTMKMQVIFISSYNPENSNVLQFIYN